MRGLQAGLLGWAVAASLSAAAIRQAAAQDSPAVALSRMSGQQLINLLVSHETEASQHRGFYEYLSVDKSDRTNGHEWTERNAETAWGKVKFLVAEDGKPLTGARLASERTRIEDEGAHPEQFRQQESARGQDEVHARQMLTLLPKAFLFDPPTQEGDFVRIKFHPNPSYSPSGVEEKVLHAMWGSVLIDANFVRMRELQASMPQDVSIGFGLATIKAGSNFSTVRGHLDGPDWKTETLHTFINGKAIFLKTIARSQEERHSDFKRMPNNISVADAVKLLEQ